jgi:glycosyltransferase involved in cell wall biosynthesis
VEIALDASYSLGDALSGVGVYSREILNGLAQSDSEDQWSWFYRPRPWWRARQFPLPARVRRRVLFDAWGNRSAALFHGLNQRLPQRRFRRQAATFHDLFVLSGEYSTPEFRARFAAQARNAAERADLIIAVSAFTARQVEELLHVPRSRIRVIHHGVLPRVIPRLSREKAVLCVGALQKRKNQAGLVRAFRALPEDWRLILAGSPGFGADEVMEQIAASSCADRIEVTGYLSETEMARWYARASLFAFPSFDEGFGMPVLEAMAAGIPVVAGNRAALPEIAGNAALLVAPESDEQIGEALRILALDENRRNQLAEAGAEHARLFTWRTAVNQTLDAYRELLS